MTKVGLRERKKRSTRERILQAAVSLFSERGIEAATVDEIAARAEVGKGTVYNYFAAKEDMVAEHVLEIEREALGGFAEILQADLAAAQTLDRVAWRLLEVKAARVPFVRAFLARLFQDVSLMDRLAPFQAAQDEALSEVFRTLRGRGEIAADRPIDDLVLSFKTLHLGLSALWAIEGPPFETARRLTAEHTLIFAAGHAP